MLPGTQKKKTMLQFKKYSSIDNVFTTEFMDKVKTEMPSGLEWVVQEKVHGSNVSFLCDGVEVKMAKRTAILEEDEKFYDFGELLDRYRPKVMSLFARIKEEDASVQSIAVFGEMFGGRYPHNDVQADRSVMLIQKGVYYTPIHEFYGFDIYLFGQESGRYLDVDEANRLFDSEGFFYAKTLFRGSLQEALQYPNAFPSKIASWLGLPELPDNICEGIVIRPVQPQYLRNGTRVLIKSKNEKFAEKKSVKKRNKIFTEPIPYSEALCALLTEMEAYVNENRLANVLSHIGEVSFPKDFGKVMGLLAQDALADFLKDQGGSYSALDKYEQKALTRELNKLAGNVVKDVAMQG